MRDWYVYHSVETTDWSFLDLGEPAVYSKKDLRKLCINDRIWVVEGSRGAPKEFSLAGCFRYTDTVYAPPTFRAPFQYFKLKITGPGRALNPAVPLDRDSAPQFDELWRSYLTKQKFFNDISEFADLVGWFEQALPAA